MDNLDHRREEEGEEEEEVEEERSRPKQLPPDLPMSLDDRRTPRSYGGETEMYDGWQGLSKSHLSPFNEYTLTIWVRLDSLHSSHLSTGFQSLDSRRGRR